LTGRQGDIINVNVIYIHREANMPIVAKLDEWGSAAWLVLVILSFIFWWPLGLAILAYVIWSGRMGCWKRGSMSRWEGAERMRDAAPWWPQHRSSGNRAFDEYRAETLRRLEEEQRAFREFLERLRFAKDRTEFDQFMAERRSRSGPAPQAQPQT
jgi:hypothetical protein